MIALLGKCDQPTDALRDYCGHLAAALTQRNITLQIVEFDWDRRGWPRAFAHLWQQSCQWQGQWVLVQYTALAWSGHGFPWRFPRVLRTLRRAGARTAVVFHDSIPSTGTRWRDVLRMRGQQRVMHRTYGLADRSIFSLPLEQIPWLPQSAPKAAFIPIGSNILSIAHATERGPTEPRRVAVFGITGSGRTSREVQDIAMAMRVARQCVGAVSLVVMGRGAEASRSALELALAGSGVDLEILGILPANDIAQKLAACDAMLFVRGEASPQRGSALAAVACGLPLVGYRGPRTCFPITKAGLELAPLDDSDALAEALSRVLRDDVHRRALREQSLRAYAEYFSWERIAHRYAEVFGL